MFQKALTLVCNLFDISIWLFYSFHHYQITYIKVIKPQGKGHPYFWTLLDPYHNKYIRIVHFGNLFGSSYKSPGMPGYLFLAKTNLACPVGHRVMKDVSRCMASFFIFYFYDDQIYRRNEIIDCLLDDFYCLDYENCNMCNDLLQCMQFQPWNKEKLNWRPYYVNHWYSDKICNLDSEIDRLKAKFFFLTWKVCHWIIK